MTICNRPVQLLLVFLLFFALTPFCYTQEDTLFTRRITWRGGENALRYAVEINRSENGNYRSYFRVYTTSHFIEISLPLGEYRFRIIPYDILDRPSEGTWWLNFEVRPAIRQETAVIEVEQVQVISVDYDIDTIQARTRTGSGNIGEVITSSTGIEMVWIPAGSFTMGSNDPLDLHAQPPHQVTLTSGFWMGRFPVTQAQYQAVMGTNPSLFTIANRRPPATGEIDARRPVETVSWYDAIVFCNKLSIKEGLTPAYEIQDVNNTSIWTTDTARWGAIPIGSNNTRWNAVRIVSGSTGYRLPTEAQWEYACRAGTTTNYNTGDVITDNTSWYWANSGDKTHQVGLKPANTWGLFDMHGNVWEWCWDRFGSYTETPKTDPTGPTGVNGVIRGGSWGSDEQFLRSANRRNYWPLSRDFTIGFRLVRP